MIILDTNIISETLKPAPSKNVVAWLAKQESTNLFLTTITIAEISYGLHALTPSKRRVFLENAFEHAIIQAFQYRILSFDLESSYLYGKLMSKRNALGKPLSIPDGQIAAIALANHADIATRNINDFVDCGLNIINPFD